jgi:hypothetical protein
MGSSLIDGLRRLIYWTYAHMLLEQINVLENLDLFQ